MAQDGYASHAATNASMKTQLPMVALVANMSSLKLHQRQIKYGND